MQSQPITHFNEVLAFIKGIDAFRANFLRIHVRPLYCSLADTKLINTSIIYLLSWPLFDLLFTRMGLSIQLEWEYKKVIQFLRSWLTLCTWSNWKLTDLVRTSSKRSFLTKYFEILSKGLNCQSSFIISYFKEYPFLFLWMIV